MLRLSERKSGAAASHVLWRAPFRRAPQRDGRERAQKAPTMLLENPGGGNPLAQPCPKCGCAGNYVRHGRYRRRIVAMGGEAVIAVARVRCMSCGATHAIIPPDVVPYRAYSESFAIAVARAWANGTSNRDVRAVFAMPESSRRRILAQVRRRLCALLSCNSARDSVAAALAPVADAAVAAMSASLLGARVAQGARLSNLRASRRRRRGRST